MTISTEQKREKDYQNFISDLEKISKKHGIGISAVGCFKFFDIDGFQEIKYHRDSSSGDLDIDALTFSDGTSM